MKKILVFLMVLAMVLSMTACGKKDEAPAADNTAESSDTGHISENPDNADNTEDTSDDGEDADDGIETGDSGNHSHTYTQTVTKAPTCTTDGEKTFTCSCGSSYEEKLPATGHNWGAWKVVKAPTTMEQGQNQRVCAACSAGETVSVPKLTADHKHSYTSGATQAATCTADGFKEFVCTCGDAYTEAVRALGHSWGDWVTVKEPTTAEGGTAKRTCSACGTTESKTLPKLTSNSSDQITVSQEALDQIKAEFLRLVNAERSRLGLGTLALNEKLDSAASIRGDEIVTLFSHTRPNGELYYTAVDASGYSYSMVGENICMTSHVGSGSYTAADKWVGSQSQIEAAAAWTFVLFKNSPGHYENMIKPQ